MPDLVILRHGNTFDKGDAVLRVGAGTDLPLSGSGREQADAVGRALAERFGGFSRIFAAPLKRTMETARRVCAAQDAPPAIETEESLTEIHYGPDEGKPEEEVVARIGADALAAWEESAAPPPGWRVDPAALTGSWRAFFEKLAGGPGPVLAVTSNGVARFALAAADEKDGDFPQKLKTAAYGVVRIGPGGGARVVAWNLRN
ncbi:histidine phosphatase family protein [Hyphococcus luteus]|uniref:Histidine phosphatase family protein n=1 Tax=Hyphococcus luteus TaxID=2058213 RepID=A0A2S7K7R7_9PROT|nr:histidine phosphatase family protein [Marinicaulis flavus]PQA88557.1 histidine phosphatase family protein [Marinicaulis flavus]